MRQSFAVRHWHDFALIGLVVTVCWRVVGYGFVHYDDYPGLVDNPAVSSGLSLGTLRWAFTSSFMNNWVPLARASHLLDIELFGFQPAGHHLVNLLFHAANTLLVFHVLRSLTGRRQASAFVAALFAVHPQHVESVAWISARRELLKDFFGLATLWAYAWQLRRPVRGRGLVVGLLFLGALLSKATLVVLPFLLLLLDYWPLSRCASGARGAPGRSRWQCLAGLVLEKTPLFAMSIVIGYITYRTHRGGMVLEPVLGLGQKVTHVLTSYVWYIGKAVWPAGLAVIYPYNFERGAGQLLAAIGLLALISLVVLAFRFRTPYLLLAWLWFLVTLLPVAGLVQTGVQGAADRYTPFAHIGAFVGVIWCAAAVFSRSGARGALAGTCFGIVLLTFAAASLAQVRVWRDDLSLFGHAAAVTMCNWVALNNLGMVYLTSGENEPAARHFQEAVLCGPVSPDVHDNLGLALFRLGRYEEAVAKHRRALQAKPLLLTAHVNLARALQKLGREDEALAAGLDAYRLSPTNLNTRALLGPIMARRGRHEAAKILLSGGASPSAAEIRTVISLVLEELARVETPKPG